MHGSPYFTISQSAAPKSYQTQELYLVNKGIQNCKPGHHYGPAARDCYFLHFILNGKGVFRNQEQEYQLHKDDIFLIHPGERVWYRADADAPWSYCWVAFSGESAGIYLQYADFGSHHPVQRGVIPNNKYLEVIEEMIQYREGTVENELMNVSLLYRLLSYLAEAQYRRSSGSGREYPREVYVEYAKEYIHYHYAHVKISDVADYIGVARSYLTMIFNQELGMTPQEYLIQVRLAKSCRLLLDTDLPLGEIARKIGYQDSFSFSKAFKSKYGKAPSFYRKAEE